MIDWISFRDKALELDAKDSLAPYQKEFHFPLINGKKALYFCGNSLGLQCKETEKTVVQELENWKEYGVEGHFRGAMPWLSYHRKVSDLSARIVGALPSETIVMNSLTANLHFLMCSFYQPKGKKTKIIIEKSAFPSDTYAVKSQIKLHGLSVEDNLVLIEANEDLYFEPEKVLACIEAHKEETALVLLSGVHYLNGQQFPMEKVAKLCQNEGINFGLDLAHAAGNIPLKLHDWGVDFAAWCSYKYLNSGPGGVAGAFIHEKHHCNSELKRLEGWWSNKETNRFEMRPDIDPYESAEAWQVSNAPVLSMAANLASLKMFDKIGLEALREKSLQLTAFLEEMLKVLGKGITILTPSNPEERGAQLSVTFPALAPDFPDKLHAAGIIADFRHLEDGKGLIRLAPVPLYNSFTDVFQLVFQLQHLI